MVPTKLPDLGGPPDGSRNLGNRPFTLELSVEEAEGMLDGLSAAQTREVRVHEKRNKNHETPIEQFDRKLKATSA